MNFKHFKNFNTFAKIIDGNLLSKSIKENLTVNVKNFTVNFNHTPGLAIIQVGDRQDSNLYIKMKLKSAEEVGIKAEHIKFSKNTNQKELLKKILDLNNDADFDGIILQLPVESNYPIDTDLIISQISINKDVDGLHPFSNGQLSHGVIKNVFLPCTPNGCIELIKSTGIQIEGKRAVVIGRSRIVGGPMSQLLIWNNATVTVCHSKTQDLPQIIAEADILVAAIGKAEFIKGEWLKPGCLVIDCGINSIPDSTKKSGYRLVGDCDYESCAERAGWITPVPGGVGPMTVTMLLKNTFDAAVRHTIQMVIDDRTIKMDEEPFSTLFYENYTAQQIEAIVNGNQTELKGQKAL